MSAVPRHWGRGHRHSAGCCNQAAGQAEVLGCLWQALSDSLALCPITCKAGHAGECKCAQFPSESLVLLAPTPRQPVHCVLLGVRALLQGAGDSFPAWIGSQKGSPEGFKLLAPADVHIPQKLWGAMPCTGERG